jgi:nucleoside-diphosphate-sugar epimerase
MQILLTGIAGFIGWRTAALLRAAGHAVTGFDDLNDGYDPSLKRWRLRDLGVDPDAPARSAADAPRFVRGDIADPVALAALFTGGRFDAVVHLAARAGVRASIADPAVYYRTNSAGTVALLEAMRRHGVNKLVLASTSSLYAGNPAPYREDQPVDRPLSPYAASKRAAELAAWTWHHLYGIDVTVVRYFTVYGPAGRPDMAPLRFTHWIASGQPVILYGDGSQARDFTYIDDIAAGTVAALRPAGYEIINLGGGNAPVPINAMIAHLETFLGRQAVIEHRPFHPADMAQTAADIGKAARLLDWTPRVDPAEGFRRTAEWYLANRAWLEKLRW